MTLTVLLLVLLGAGEPPEPRKPSPFAPSLPQLTEEEEAAYDAVVERFIRYDSGQLRGEGADQARREFDKLGPDATFALIRGLNRAAGIEHSCPALIIARKLARIFTTSDDKDLMEYARENIGQGLRGSRHAGTLQDLRMLCMYRKNALEAGKVSGAGNTIPAPRPPHRMTVAELAEAATTERGTRLKLVMMELSHRPGDDALAALAAAAALSYEADNKQLAREFLERSLARQPESVLKTRLKDKRAEVRAASARVAGAKKLRLADELIDLLEDDDEDVREAAHRALLALSGGEDFGPAIKADETARTAAARKWRAWWAARP